VRKPTAENHGETNCDCDESDDRFLWNSGASRNGERNCEKYQSEREDHIAENVDARNPRAAHAETVLDRKLI
jgi:hypothetical protein